MMTSEANTATRETVDRPRDGDRIRSRYLGDVFAYASRRLASREDAEDATAETFHAALQNLHRLKTEDPRLWLFGIARRKVADIARRRQRRNETALREDLPATHGSSFEQQESRAEIRRIVDRLPDDQREALMLKYLEDLSLREISVVVNRSEAAVNSLLQRARANVLKEGRAYFEPQSFEPGQTQPGSRAGENTR